MQLGDVIKKYRKAINLTQEEMARRLSVTASAVNKWENGHSLPDISLLSPLARLFGISVDTLLSHENTLSDPEANRLIEKMHERLKAGDLSGAFEWMKGCIREYPSSHYLLLNMARVLDAHLLMTGAEDRQLYDRTIIDCYERSLPSENAASEALFYHYINSGDYAKAEEYLREDSPEFKQRQALIYSKTGRIDDARRAYAALLYSGYNSMNMTLSSLYTLALSEGDHQKARMLTGKLRALAHLFEMGEYHEISGGLEMAALEKDEAATLSIAQRMLSNLESIYGFTQSPLFEHMDFSPLREGYLAEVRESLLKGFRDEEAFSFMKENPDWQRLIG